MGVLDAVKKLGEWYPDIISDIVSNLHKYEDTPIQYNPSFLSSLRPLRKISPQITGKFVQMVLTRFLLEEEYSPSQLTYTSMNNHIIRDKLEDPTIDMDETLTRFNDMKIKTQDILVDILLLTYDDIFQKSMGVYPNDPKLYKYLKEKYNKRDILGLKNIAYKILDKDITFERKVKYEDLVGYIDLMNEDHVYDVKYVENKKYLENDILQLLLYVSILKKTENINIKSISVIYVRQKIIKRYFCDKLDCDMILNMYKTLF